MGTLNSHAPDAIRSKLDIPRVSLHPLAALGRGRSFCLRRPSRAFPGVLGPPERRGWYWPAPPDAPSASEQARPVRVSRSGVEGAWPGAMPVLASGKCLEGAGGKCRSSGSCRPLESTCARWSTGAATTLQAVSSKKGNAFEGVARLLEERRDERPFGFLPHALSHISRPDPPSALPRRAAATQSGHWNPTGAMIWQSGQIGRSQRWQLTPAGRLVCRKQTGSDPARSLTPSPYRGPAVPPALRRPAAGAGYSERRAAEAP